DRPAPRFAPGNRRFRRRGARGHPDRVVRRLAICSGSGDSLLAAAKAAGADAYLTADLRHHPATDHIWDGGCALICATHWASEWPVLGEMEQRLRERFPQLDTYISEIPTDAWNIALRG
ncbi:Nif3-like dinuclear metal center hexameric protein, partial [Actinotignum timonense]|nr:Nif3-like dinuclear metal center hexameric protein [Actinotignum timonense]